MVELNRFTVYPRVCGGTIEASTGHIVNIGLSPRVRGNLERKRASVYTTGSIPACAGEPRPDLQRQLIWMVYPCVCGGTLNTRLGLTGEAGLSPRVRGNQAAPLLQGSLLGSIPACAGEPAGSRAA